MKSILLSSGNRYYYEDSKNGFLSFGFLVSQDDTFKGGFLGKEARRKYAIFSGLKGVVTLHQNVTYDLKKVKLQEFAEKLGSASVIFIKNFIKEVNDLDDFNGTGSKAQSCDDRVRYYRSVGLDEVFKNRLRFTVGLFIANHISIFGVANFRETFFRGKNEPEPGDSVDLDTLFKKNVYDDCGFIAPAAYIKALCNA